MGVSESWLNDNLNQNLVTYVGLEVLNIGEAK